MFKFFIPLLVVGFLFGCAGNPTAVRGGEIANSNLYKEKSPFRVDVKVLEGGGAVMNKIWAGEKGSSIVESADDILKSDIWKLFEKKCAFSKSDLAEVRVVEHKHPFYYEVWVFKNQLSKRADGTSGISLILNFPPSGGTDIELVGECRT